MAFLRALVHIEAPPERVWELVAGWERQAEWMVDATSVVVLTARREGVGTRIRAVTTVAGIPVADPMEVTRWEPGRLVEVRHLGWPIRGIAWFDLRPSLTGTWFEWAEELDPPLGPLGEAGATVLRGALERMLGRSLATLKRLAESQPAERIRAAVEASSD